ncbi:PD-(D/E)XK nuclease family protein [Blattabacterium cuenoti]|uniref:PD-(D/E)XK nuclease family protein n=1 Tax=Blattabacterium cuenoti TaxID=1653831 RepID=UPI00163B67F3|nr:PD-(D/E)XK nuclease family protein [Blattabacterium cuenoti]
MKKKIDQIIQHLLQKINLNQKYIFISKEDAIIEYIKNKYKSKFNQKTEFFTMEKFFEKISGLKILNNHSILLDFFYMLKTEDFLHENFNNFFHWGPKILNDFQSIDINMINVEYFFSSIISTEKIKKWNFNILEQKKNFFWEKIREYYYIMQSQFLQKGFTYKGMLFKRALSHFNFFLYKNSKINIIFFIDIILNQCEKIFVQKIMQYDNGLVYNLYDKNIFENKNIISKEHKKLSNLKIIEVSKELEQVKVVENIIEKLIQKGKKPYNILIIPGDNFLLIPLLHSIKKLNINLSINIDYSYKNIPIYYTFYYIFQFLLKKDKYVKFLDKKNVIKLLSDGYIQKFFLKKNFLLKKLIIDNDSNMISENVIKKYLLKNDLWIIFQIPIYNTKIILLSIISFIRKFKKLLFKNINKHFLELKFLFKLEIYIQKLRIIVRKKNLILGINNVFHIYEQFVNTESIRYIHKNKRGLHITGYEDFFLKNFDTVIITSFNEGIIPPKNYEKNYSFISLDLRKKLQIKDFNNDIYFSHFMRIFQYSKYIYLIYKNKQDEINSGEKSRFIHQIEMNYKISTEKIKNTFFPINFTKKPIVIEKTKSIIHRLHELITKGLSPSSIRLYNYNPLLFYYKKILNLNDPEENYFNKKEVGKVIHKILKILYYPIKESFININHIYKMKKIYESIIKKILLGKKKIMKGENMLFYYIIKTYIKNFIKWDEKSIQNGHKIFLKKIEYKISTVLNIGSIKVNLHGIIDRIDEYDGITRIIDYKIGFSKIKEMNISLKNIKNIFQDPNYANIMQLLIYVYLWFKYSISFKKKRITTPIGIGIVSPAKNGIILQIPINFFDQKKINITYEDYKINFLPFLINRISEILDPKTPIIETI